jgi:hypothetical protein
MGEAWENERSQSNQKKQKLGQIFQNLTFILTYYTFLVVQPSKLI